MLSCPECGEAGIAEHSVIASSNALASLGEDAPTYARCRRCDALFTHPSPGELARTDDVLEGRTVWVTPPWKGEGGAFELSWDVVEAYYEDYDGEFGVEPLQSLIAELRQEGYDTKLRAGQSLHALGLSRAKEHGLREDQSHLWIIPHDSDGQVRVEGLLAGQKHRFGPVPCRFTARIRKAIEALAAEPID